MGANDYSSNRIFYSFCIVTKNSFCNDIYVYLFSIINIDANNVRIVNVNFTDANDYSNNVRIRTRRISEIIISKDLVKI